MSETEPAESEADAAAHQAMRETIAPHEVPDDELETADECLQKLIEEARAVEAAMRQFQTANSFESAARAAVGLVLAAELAESAGKRAVDVIARARVALATIETAARVALARGMTAANIGAVQTRYHVATPHLTRESVEIVDPAALPSALWRVPEPAPDKTAIGVALRRGPVPGARLVGGGPTVRIAARKEKTR